MKISEPVRQLLTGLSSARDEILAEALTNAGLLLEQHGRYLACQERTGDQGRAGIRSSEAHDRTPQIRQEYQELGLPEHLLGLVLTDREIDALVDALFGLLERGPPTVAGAAGALSRAGRLTAVPHVSEAVRRYAASDWIAVPLIYALSQLLISADPGRPLTPAEETILRDSCAALRWAAEHGLGSRVCARRPTRSYGGYQGTSDEPSEQLRRDTGPG